MANKKRDIQSDPTGNIAYDLFREQILGVIKDLPELSGAIHGIETKLSNLPCYLLDGVKNSVESIEDAVKETSYQVDSLKSALDTHTNYSEKDNLKVDTLLKDFTALKEKLQGYEAKIQVYLNIAGLIVNNKKTVIFVLSSIAVLMGSLFFTLANPTVSSTILKWFGVL